MTLCPELTWLRGHQVLGIDPEDDPRTEILVRIETPGGEPLTFSTNQLSGRAALPPGEYSMTATLSSPSTLVMAATAAIRFRIIDPESWYDHMATSLRSGAPHGELVQEGVCRREILLQTHGREGSGTDGDVVLSLVGPGVSSGKILLPKTAPGQEHARANDTYVEGGVDCWELLVRCDETTETRAGGDGQGLVPEAERQRSAPGASAGWCVEKKGCGAEVSHVVIEHRTTNNWRGFVSPLLSLPLSSPILPVLSFGV